MNGTEPVAIVSQAAARRYWGDDNPVGRRIRLSPQAPWMTVVGLVGDVQNRRLDEPPQPILYRTLEQSSNLTLALLVRSSQGPGEPSTARIAQLTVREALGEAFSHRGYVLLVLGFFVCGFHVTFITVHLPKYLNDIGLGWSLAADAFIILGVFNVASCLVVGVVATALSKRGVLAAIYLGRAVVITAFVLTPPSVWSVYLFAATMGVLWLSTVPVTQGLVAQVFGTQYMTMLFGFAFFSHQIGAFLGVYLGAEAVDRLGSYEMVWYAAVGLGLFAALCHIPIDERPLARLAPKPATGPAQ